MEGVKKYEYIIFVFTTLVFFIWTYCQIYEIKRNINIIEKDFSIIKTILIMKNIYPTEFAVTKEEM